MAAKPVVVVTGASKGLGLAVTTLLLQKFNSIVVAIARTKTPEIDALQSHGDSLLFTQCDVADTAAFDAAVTQAKQKYGHVDAVVLNAAVFEPTGKITSSQLDVDAWRAHFDVNFFSQVAALRSLIPWMHTNTGDIKGRLIFVSSGAAIGNIYGWAPYNASKAAANSLCRTVAQEEPDIVAVAVRPGKVDTAIRQLAGSENMRPEDVAMFVNEHDEGKLLDPMEAGHVLAAMAVSVPKEFSGKFLSWDSEECSAFWDSK